MEEKGYTRKRTASLSVDGVGYSRLVEDKEEDAVWIPPNSVAPAYTAETRSEKKQAAR